MKKLNILAIAAAAVLTLGTTTALSSCGDSKKPGSGDESAEVAKADLRIVSTEAADAEIRMGQKAKIKFTNGTTDLTADDLGKLLDGANEFKTTVSPANAAVLVPDTDPSKSYVAFSKEGEVTITVSSKNFKTASITFQVLPRKYVEGMTNLVISGPAKHSGFMTDMATKFNAKRQANEQVNFIFEDHGEDKLDSEVLDWKNGPDVFAFASDKIAELTNKGAIGPLEGDYKNHILNTMTAGAQEAAAFPTADDITAYPYAGDNGYYLFYNKGALTESDVSSIENLFAKAKTLGKKVGYPLNTPFYSAGALFSFGARYTMQYDDNGDLNAVTANFDGAEGLKAGKAILQIMSNKDVWTNDQDAPNDDSKLVACVNGSWAVSDYMEKMGDDFACCKLPTITIDGETANLHSFLGYKLYGVNDAKQDSATAKVAHDFAKFITEKDQQKDRFTALQIAPTNTELQSDPAVLENEAIKAINAQSEFAVAQTAVPAGVWTAPGIFTQAIIDGDVTVDNIQTYLTTLNNNIKKIDK